MWETIVPWLGKLWFWAVAIAGTHTVMSLFVIAWFSHQKSNAKKIIDKYGEKILALRKMTGAPPEMMTSVGEENVRKYDKAFQLYQTLDEHMTKKKLLFLSQIWPFTLFILIFFKSDKSKSA